MDFTHEANPVRVNARQITEVTPTVKSTGMLDPIGFLAEFANGPNVYISPEMAARHLPKVGDYVVTQEDGYVYVNPKEVFERKYRRL